MRAACLIGTFALFAGATAEAHVEVSSGPAPANVTAEVVFSVGHGCAGNDTYRVTIDIPAGVTSVRPLRSDFGRTTVQKDMAGVVTSVTWQKADTDALDSDTNYYKLAVRLKAPNTPFTNLYFPTHQVCRAMNGTLSTAEWVGTPSTPTPDAGTIDPAPVLTIVPPRVAGWNKFTVTQAISDLSVYFKDALIVWRGSAAYSSNPNTATQITATAGVTALTAVAAGDEVWVKY